MDWRQIQTYFKYRPGTDRSAQENWMNMGRRFVSIWFPYLRTDWFGRHKQISDEAPIVLVSPDHGRIIVTAVNARAQSQGINPGMVLADARVIIPFLQVFDDKPTISEKLLTGLAEWCIRFSPSVGIDLADGLLIDATGCTHLWGDETNYIQTISTRLKKLGYYNRVAIADTIGCAWAISHFGENSFIIEPGQQTSALLSLSPAALRLEEDVVERLEKLGLCSIKRFIGMPRSALRRRFGPQFLQKLDVALGYKEEVVQPVHLIEPYQERLPCLEPIITATGIEIALQRLLETLCNRLQQQQKGIRAAVFKCYRIDGKTEKIEIGTNHATHNVNHLFKLFEIRISTIEPALGIELFTLEAPKVEEISPLQEKLWEKVYDLDNVRLSELLDRLAGKMGANSIHRYLPDEHYWPERSIKPASSLQEKPTTTWKLDTPRPLQLLSCPEAIEVTAPIPDYPPMLFRYKGKLHKIIKADGPERIEQEWWLQEGLHRDYYRVEDEEGCRYWLFRSGHYSEDKAYKWFIHGFFA